LVYGVTGVLALGSVLLAALRFWPLCWLAYHGTPVTRWLGRAWAISGASLMTSFFLMVVLGVLLGLGFSLFGLGLLLAMPLGGLIGEVAWRRISGRAIPVLDASSGPSESRRPS
jgi:hypothetical protein